MRHPRPSPRQPSPDRSGRAVASWLALPTGVTLLLTVAACFTFHLEEATHEIRAVYDAGEWSVLAVELESVSDRVTVQGVSGGTVEATLSASALVSDGAATDLFEGLSLAFDNDAGTLRLRTHYTGTRAEQVVIDAVDIALPRMGGLYVPSAPAPITVRDVAGPVAVYGGGNGVYVSGCLDVTVSTDSGPIEAELSADASLITGSGAIYVELVDEHRDTLYIESSSGPIEVHLSPLVSYTIELEVDAALVSYDVGFESFVHDGSAPLYETVGFFGPRIIVVSHTGPVTITDF